MDIFIYLLLVTLASTRLCSLLQDELGPFDIFQKLRHYVGLYEVDTLPIELQSQFIGQTSFYNENGIKFFADLIQCLWCLSIWTGFVFLFIVYLSSSISLGEMILLTFASSYLVIQLDRYTGD
jgi:hypothetical protein